MTRMLYDVHAFKRVRKRARSPWLCGVRVTYAVPRISGGYAIVAQYGGHTTSDGFWKAYCTKPKPKKFRLFA